MTRIWSWKLDQRLFCLLILILLLRVTSLSQTLPSEVQPTPVPSPTPSLEKQFFRNILRDQVGIWTAPFHMSRDDAKLVLPIGVATAALIAIRSASSGSIPT